MHHRVAPRAADGLLGYEIDGAPFRRTHGIRRIVALKVDRRAPASEFENFALGLATRPSTRAV